MNRHIQISTILTSVQSGHIRVYTHLYTCVHAYTCVYTQAHANAFVWMCVALNLSLTCTECMYVCVYMYICVYNLLYSSVMLTLYD